MHLLHIPHAHVMKLTMYDQTWIAVNEYSVSDLKNLNSITSTYI